MRVADRRGGAGRPNLIARVAGRGEAAPLLLQGHVDVVAARGEWRHPPFGGELHDGYVWGRGALDMKGGVAMMLAAFMRIHAAETPPPGDVILCVLADEEAGSDSAPAYLVREHPGLFDGRALRDRRFGGFTNDRRTPLLPDHGGREAGLLDARNAPRSCRTRLDAGARRRHGAARAPARPARRPASAGARDSGAAGDDRGLGRRAAGGARAAAARAAAAAPHRPRARSAGTPRRAVRPLLHNTASPTVVRGGDKINVIPGEVSVDARRPMLPGMRPEDLFAELRALAGVEMELEVLRHDPPAAEPDMGLFGMLAGVLASSTRGRRRYPMLLPGITDGRFFAQLGIKTYGFPARCNCRHRCLSCG